MLPKALNWDLVNDPDDVDQQSLLFHYPTVFAVGGYLRPVVKIEMGARSDTEPVAMPTVQAYLAEALPQLFKDSTFTLQALTPERTFWEKAMREALFFGETPDFDEILGVVGEFEKRLNQA